MDLLNGIYAYKFSQFESYRYLGEVGGCKGVFPHKNIYNVEHISTNLGFHLLGIRLI